MTVKEEEEEEKGEEGRKLFVSKSRKEAVPRSRLSVRMRMENKDINLLIFRCIFSYTCNRQRMGGEVLLLLSSLGTLFEGGNENCLLCAA